MSALHFLNNALFALAALSLIIGLWRWIASCRFHLHERISTHGPLPAVTLLKPLKGCDPEIKVSLRSWMTQKYSGPMQILFGVASAEDPVCKAVRELLAEYPHVDAQLIICSEHLGVNAKVSTLCQLQPLIKHPFVVLSDADVRSPEDFLANVLPSFEDPEIGLVNCFYSSANPTTLAMHWEAIAINADFWSEVLQARSLKDAEFALGAMMAVPKDVLEKIGGFTVLADYLADDYRLGQEVARLGRKIKFASIAVECWEAPMDFAKVWRHQLRWGRTIRCCQPIPFFFSILSNSTLWPLVYWLNSIIKPGHWGSKPALGLLILSLAFRIGSALHQQLRLTRSTAHFRYWWLIPIKDLFNVFLWASSFLGHHVMWRGVRYRIIGAGKLVRIS